MKDIYEDDFLDETPKEIKKPKPKTNKPKNLGRMNLIEFLTEITKEVKLDDHELMMEMAQWFSEKDNKVYSMTPEELWDESNEEFDWTIDDWYWFVGIPQIKRYTSTRQASRMSILANKHLDALATRGDLTTSQAQLFRLLKDLVENAEKNKPTFMTYSSTSLPRYLSSLYDEISKEESVKGAEALVSLIRKV